MFKFLRKTLLYIILAPYLITGLGIASNQAVLFANKDRFPVMWNDYKVAQYAIDLEKVSSGKDQDAAIKAALQLEALKAEGFLDDEHVVMTPHTHLNWMADIFDFGSEGTQSIGDILLDLGGWAANFSPFIWAGVMLRKLYE